MIDFLKSKRTPLLFVAWIVVGGFFALSPYLGFSSSLTRQVLFIALLALVVSGLNISFGFAGELSFAQPAMYAVGAYATVVMTRYFINDLLVILLISIVGGLLLGLISGIPALRLGGWMLAISSLYIVLIVPDLVNAFAEFTGGPQGAIGIPLPQIFGITLRTDAFVTTVVLITIAWFAIFRNLVISRTGRTFAVVRESPILASSLGISVSGFKMKAYAISGIPAAIAGTLLGFTDGYVAPQSFSVHFSISVLAACVLGGKRSVYGVFLGAAFMRLGPTQSTVFGDYAFIAYGLFLIIAGVALQTGIAGLFHKVVQRIQSRRAKLVVAASAPTSAPVLAPIAPLSLDISEVSKAFGGVAALSDVSFRVDPGEVVALIGPNGSGKTTLLNAISGYYKVDTGRITVGDQGITGLSTHRVARAGVARTFQTPLIPELTVRDAIAVARTETSRVSIVETMFRLPRYGRVLREDAVAVDKLLADLGLVHVADQQARSLPLGTRRLLELARAIASGASVFLLDEVASGLDDEEIKQLSAVIHAIRTSGGSVLLVEHNFSLVRSIADRVAVLSRGKLVALGDPESIASHPEVLEHYLGQPADSLSISKDTADHD